MEGSKNYFILELSHEALEAPGLCAGLKQSTFVSF